MCENLFQIYSHTLFT